jgi:hypothetical protein
VNDLARHRLWSKWDELLGEELAGHLMELLRPAYDSIITRQLEGGHAIDTALELSPAEDRRRHSLWRKLEEKLGVEEAATMIEFWDEAGRIKRGSRLSGVA